MDPLPHGLDELSCIIASVSGTGANHQPGLIATPANPSIVAPIAGPHSSPIGHSAQAVEPAYENLPRSHAEHIGAASTFVYVPRGQALHRARFSADVLKKSTSMQGSTVLVKQFGLGAAALTFATSPLPHAVANTYVATVALLQSVVVVEAETTDAFEPLDAALQHSTYCEDVLPVGHVSHVVAPVRPEKSPGAHTLHSATPCRGANFPGTHACLQPRPLHCSPLGQSSTCPLSILN